MDAEMKNMELENGVGLDSYEYKNLYPTIMMDSDLMACVVNYSAGAGYPVFDIARLVARAPHNEEKERMLDIGIWYVVYPSRDYATDRYGWSYDIYRKYNGEWCEVSMNAMCSAAHMLPFFESKSDAESAAREAVCAYAEGEAEYRCKNPNVEFYKSHIMEVYSRREEIKGDPEILGASLPTFHGVTLGDLLDEWDAPESYFVHKCPKCGGRSVTIFLSGNFLTGSKSMSDMCEDDGTVFSTTTSNKCGYSKLLKSVKRSHEKSGLDFYGAYCRLKEKSEANGEK